MELAGNSQQERALQDHEARARDESGISLDDSSLLALIRLLNRNLNAAVTAREHTPSRQLFDRITAVVKGLLNDSRYQDNDAIILAGARILNAIEHRDEELTSVLSCIGNSLGMIELALTTANGAPADNGELPLNKILDLNSL